jgi:hypothetical protein
MDDDNNVTTPIEGFEEIVATALEEEKQQREAKAAARKKRELEKRRTETQAQVNRQNRISYQQREGLKQLASNMSQEDQYDYDTNRHALEVLRQGHSPYRAGRSFVRGPALVSFAKRSKEAKKRTMANEQKPRIQRK